MAAQMAAHPDASLPAQMADPGALKAAYRVLNHGKVTMEQLLTPQCHQTLAAARRHPVVLWIEDTTELDYTTHVQTTGLGPIGNGQGRGFLLHSTLAVLPDDQTVLGLAHAQVVVRPPQETPAPHRRHTAESRVWEVSAQQVGRPPAGQCWVHVSDRASDLFAYLVTCVDLGKHFVVRAYQNRTLVCTDPCRRRRRPASNRYARSWSPHPAGDAVVDVPARPGNQRARRRSCCSGLP